MYRKSIVMLSIILAILFVSTFSFAVSANDVKNTINNGTDTVVDGIDNLGEDVRNGVGSIENGVEGALRSNDDMMNNTNTTRTGSYPTVRADETNTNSYVATRTTDTTTGSTTATTWVWIIIAVAAVVIIGLVWYYIAQDNNVE